MICMPKKEMYTNMAYLATLYMDISIIIGEPTKFCIQLKNTQYVVPSKLKLTPKSNYLC